MLELSPPENSRLSPVAQEALAILCGLVMTFGLLHGTFTVIGKYLEGEVLSATFHLGVYTVIVVIACCSLVYLIRMPVADR